MKSLDICSFPSVYGRVIFLQRVRRSGRERVASCQLPEVNRMVFRGLFAGRGWRQRWLTSVCHSLGENDLINGTRDHGRRLLLDPSPSPSLLLDLPPSPSLLPDLPPTPHPSPRPLLNPSDLRLLLHSPSFPLFVEGLLVELLFLSSFHFLRLLLIERMICVDSAGPLSCKD